MEEKKNIEKTMKGNENEVSVTFRETVSHPKFPLCDIILSNALILCEQR